MKFALVIPGAGLVPAVFAHDLARVVGHVAVTRPDVEVRVLAAAEEEPSPELAEELLAVAREWGADAIVFPDVNKRIPAVAFDRMFAALDAEVAAAKKPLIEVVSH